METGAEGLPPQDDCGLWMKMDFNPVTDLPEPTDSGSSATLGEGPQDDTVITPPDPAVITRYYGVMDDEGADIVFNPPATPPSYMVPLSPAGGNAGGMVSKSSVTPIKGTCDVTEAEANPSGLPWHHSEEPLMAPQSETGEVIAGTAQTSKESMDTESLSDRRDSITPTDQDQAFIEGTSSPVDQGDLWDSTTVDEPSNEDAEDTFTVSDEEDSRLEGGAERDERLESVASYVRKTSENEAHCDEEGDQTGKGGSVPSLEGPEDGAKTEHVNCEGDESQTLELHDCNQNKTDTVKDPKEETDEDEEDVDIRPINYNLTRSVWARRDSCTSELQTPDFPISGALLSPSDEQQELLEREQQGGGGMRLSTDIQQGEQLLQRLQLVQQRQREERDEEEGSFGTGEDESTAREGGSADGEERELNRFHTQDQESKTNLVEEEGSESKERMSSPAVPSQPEQLRTASAESHNSDDDQRGCCMSEDSSQINTHETFSSPTPSVSPLHRFSVAETSLEKQLHEAAQVQQNLQRAAGVFDLADNPDVLEIPFNTSIVLEPPTKVGPGQHRSCQFSEQKMQKEIRQEIQRELVLVNQGKIPGRYSKGEVRQLKETKLLFEAFQQDNTEGPVKTRKPPSSFMNCNICPTVLERTRSLEMFSLKSCPISRAHSLRLCRSATSEMEKSPENVRSSSLTGGSWDKTCLSPYPKKDKYLRLCRSMDSISTDPSAADRRSKRGEGCAGEDSPILKQNPFFKLRPALALQPEVEKDIRRAREREAELRRQRCTLYGENEQSREEEEESSVTSWPAPGVKQPSRGKLERVWPPASKKEKIQSEQTKQEPKVPRAGQKAPLWQRWESGQINGQLADKHD